MITGEIRLTEGDFLERRLYFLAGDALSNVSAGMCSAWLATFIADPSWGMLSAMLAGMSAGMLLSLFLMPLFVSLFGAMEVMLPVMLSAMLAGMVFGMLDAMHALDTFEALTGGALIGMLVLVSTYAIDAALKLRRS